LEGLFNELNLTQTTDERNVYLWKQEHQPASYQTFRIAQTEMQKRDADDLPPEEIANGVREILRNQISLHRSDLIKEVSKLFGYARIGPNVEAAMNAGINAAINKGYGNVDKDRVVYKG
jgi:hypothetical protein